MQLNALALATFFLVSFSAALPPNINSRGKVGDALKGAEGALLQAAAPLLAGLAGGATPAGSAPPASGTVAASGDKGATPVYSAESAVGTVAASSKVRGSTKVKGDN